MTTISFVVLLLLFSCPSAVTWKVTKVHVDPVNAKALSWSLSHIAKKTLVGEPSVADCDAAPAVKVVLPVFRVKAALFYSSPAIVGQRPLLSSMPVSRGFSGRCFYSKASAALRLSASKFSARDAASTAAITCAFPVVIAPARTVEGNNDKPTKSFSMHVDSVVSSRRYAPAGFCSSRCYRVGRNHFFRATVAATQPSSSAFAVVIRAAYGSEQSKLLSGYVFKSHSLVLLVADYTRESAETKGSK